MCEVIKKLYFRFYGMHTPLRTDASITIPITPDIPRPTNKIIVLLSKPFLAIASADSIATIISVAKISGSTQSSWHVGWFAWIAIVRFVVCVDS